jgi:hypothetical protein
MARNRVEVIKSARREAPEIIEEILAGSDLLSWPPPWSMTRGSDGEEAGGHQPQREAREIERLNLQQTDLARSPPPDSTVSQAIVRLQVGPNKCYISINQRCLKPRELRALWR